MAENDWLVGQLTGFRGPWGTTYPANLRLSVQSMTEEQFVTMLNTRTTQPPMPWPSVREMTDDDKRAIYAYIKSLGPKGSPAPPDLMADEEPTGPFVWEVPPPPKGAMPQDAAQPVAASPAATPEVQHP
jgi:hypothetical protein